MKIADVNTVYLYDEIYRLVFVDYDDGNSTDYIYDCLDNWVESDGSTPMIYLHNELNQYTQVGPSGSRVTYDYDDNGNLSFDGAYHYRYDCENRLIDVNDQSNNRVASYSYDYAGRRISKTLHASQDTLHYVYDGSQVIAEYSGSGTQLRKFIYGPGIDEPICMITCSGGETKYFYHFDGLGSVVALSNSSGTVIEQYHYDVFGTPSIASSVGNRVMGSHLYI
jgi:YD repeat-containing protein